MLKIVVNNDPNLSVTVDRYSDYITKRGDEIFKNTKITVEQKNNPELTLEKLGDIFLSDISQLTVTDANGNEKKSAVKTEDIERVDIQKSIDGDLEVFEVTMRFR